MTHSEELRKKIAKLLVGLIDNESDLYIMIRSQKTDELLDLINQEKRELIERLANRNDEYKSWCDCPTCEDIKVERSRMLEKLQPA